MPSSSITGLSTWCTPVATWAPTSTRAVTPDAAPQRTGREPPAAADGTRQATRFRSAYTTRAGWPPMLTSGMPQPSPPTPGPSTTIRPPGTAAGGCTDAMGGRGA